jgi:hypothetical protein
MAEKKRFLLRVDPDVYRAIEKWAADDLRSVNAQIEFLLKDALARAGRARGDRSEDGKEPPDA